MTALVPGAGGFIDSHLVRRLLDDGGAVRAVDIEPLEQRYQVHSEAENVVADCSDPAEAHMVAVGTEEICNFAADVSGMGFIENNKAEWTLSVLTSANKLLAARDAGTMRSLTAVRTASTTAPSRLTRT